MISSEIVILFKSTELMFCFQYGSDDVRPLKDWTVSAANKPCCSAVIDSQGNITCVFQQLLRTWTAQTAVLDKSKKTKVRLSEPQAESRK